MRIIFAIILFFGFQLSFSQKVTEREMDATDVVEIAVLADEVFSISIESEERETVKIQAIIEGEYYESVLLQVTSEAISENKIEQRLSIGTGYTPFFEKENDKLAAHKVISIDLLITIPKNLKVSVSSSLASVQAKGSFESLNVSIKNGHCLLVEFKGNTQIHTQNGDITFYANEKSKKQYSVDAITKKGILINHFDAGNIYHLEARSVLGNISLITSN